MWYSSNLYVQDVVSLHIVFYTNQNVTTNTVKLLCQVQKNKDGRYLEIKGPKPSVLGGGVYCRKRYCEKPTCIKIILFPKC